MRQDLHRNQETLQLDIDSPTFKELLRDLLFREAGKPYFKRFATPRRYRLLGAWRRLSTYQAERQLLPVGGQNTEQLIQRFLSTHGCLRAEFQEGGMPVSAIHVLRQLCPPLNAALEQVQVLECTLSDAHRYRVSVAGGPLPPSASSASPSASS